MIHLLRILVGAAVAALPVGLFWVVCHFFGIHAFFAALTAALTAAALYTLGGLILNWCDL